MKLHKLKEFEITPNSKESFPKKAFLILEVGKPGRFGYGCEMEEILRVELDSEDLEYLKNKYLPKELEIKEQEFSETLKKLNLLESEIKELKNRTWIG